MRLAAATLLPRLRLILVPMIAFATLFRIAWGDGSLAVDFHNEIYPESKELVHAESPFPEESADLSHGSNHIWPPLVGYVATPVIALSPSVADIVIVVIGLACFGASYFAVTAIPLAIVRPRFAWIWLLPILTVGTVSAGARIGGLTEAVRVLAIFAVVVWHTERRERGVAMVPALPGAVEPTAAAP